MVRAHFLAAMALAAALAGCTTAPSTERAAADAPLVGVAAAPSPAAASTLSSGLNTTTTERVIVAQPAGSPAPPAVPSGQVVGGSSLANSPNAGAASR